MNINMTKIKWEQLHTQSRFRPKYPSELIVQFIFRNFIIDNNTKILDLGCGAGRHTYFMANEGIDVYGVDISKKGVEYTKKLLENNNLKGTIEIATIDKLPYKDNYFDGIISYGVLYYCTSNMIAKSVDEIYRVLKKDGKAIIVVRSINDYRFGQGKEIEKNTFIINELDSNKNSYNENDMLMHFFEEEELKNLFKKFSNIKIDRIIETHEGQKFKDNNYIVRIKK